MALPNLLTAAEAAGVLRMTPWEVRRKIRDGKIPATKPGRAWLIDEDDLAAYIDAHKREAVA